ncbi:GNAT family N-acetyltransferase [Microlunatus soli]|uniref:Acetyltransferase (GNAT) family protein n=1 Tax=Microlunatus soli TaxID=630515 RepID=A0A1H1WTD9_9ACTN|nr:GNAT family N-acetyltransferase [Microlunatus soli]SDT00453.1 Acetyltransferase (GNAT) family protein [Microlunatus soli]
MASSTNAAPLAVPRIESLGSDDDAEAFRRINTEWISRLFTLTDEDRALLNDPRGRIIDPGGDVLLARADDGSVVGCVALVRYPDDVLELSKMGVTPAAQGRGVGRLLVAGAIGRARELGARRLFLGTNSALTPAIHLYREAGFVPIGREHLPVTDYYARADVLMELPGSAGADPTVGTGIGSVAATPNTRDGGSATDGRRGRSR